MMTGTAMPLNKVETHRYVLHEQAANEDLAMASP